MGLRGSVDALISFAMRRERAALLAIFVLAFVLRAGFAMTMRNEFYFGDSERYSEVACNVREGRGFVLDDAWPFLPFPDLHPGPYYAASPPGYSAFLAGCYLIAGRSLLFIRIVQALIGAATCLIVFRIGDALCGRKAAFAAGAISAVYPFLVFFSGLVLTEALFVLLCASFLMVVVELSEKPSFPLAGVAGAVAAWGVQVRSSFIVLPILLLAALVWRAVDRRRFLMAGGCVLMSMGFFLLPWTILARVVAGLF